MHKTIALATGELAYKLKTSERSRNLRLTIHADGRVVVTAPALMSERFIEQLILQKSPWILSKLERFKRVPAQHIIESGLNSFSRYKNQAFELVVARLAYFNTHYRFSFRKVTIKKQKSRWGSCSKKGSLNFNYKIALLSPALADYIIVHELCHLAEFNHGKPFWSRVAEMVPSHRELRRELRRTIIR